MQTCRHCGADSSAEFCQQCSIWFVDSSEPDPVPTDPYATLAPEPAAQERRWRIGVVAALAVIGIAAGGGLALLFAGDGDAPRVASPAPRPTAHATPSTPASPTPAPEPTVVVTVTATASPEAPTEEPVDTPEPEPDPVEQRFERFYPLGRGDGGYVVAALQGLLADQGVRTFIDGDFGAATERSVRQWQAQQGLTVSGIVDDTTWETLTPDLRQGASGGAVEVLQLLLDARGYQTIIDGDFGEQTAAAVRAFQSDRGLVVDGFVGTQSWAALLS